SARSSSWNSTSCRSRTEWTCTTSGNGSSPERRSNDQNMPITGVMPEPAVTNMSLSGVGDGRWKSPAGAASRTMVPGLTVPTMWLLSTPSGIALTVTEYSPLPDVGAEVNEYERQVHRPSSSTPIPRYWPGWSVGVAPQPALITRVTTSSASRPTATISPRSSRDDHSG